MTLSSIYQDIGISSRENWSVTSRGRHSLGNRNKTERKDEMETNETVVAWQLIALILGILCVGIIGYYYGRRDLENELDEREDDENNTPCPCRSIDRPCVDAPERYRERVHTVWIVLKGGAILEVWHDGQYSLDVVTEDRDILPDTITDLEERIDDGTVRPGMFVK